MSDRTMPRHWSREPWPWILMSLPASAVVAGFATLWLAIQSDNSMVVDDYYKEGKAINQRIARDERASELGLGARVTLADGGLAIVLSGTLPQPLEVLGVRFVHVAHAEHDREVVARAAADGRLSLPGPLDLAPGRYRVHLEPPARDWRLVSEVIAIDGQSTARFDVRAGEIARYRVGAPK